MKKALSIVVLVLAMAAFPASALGAQPTNANCWGSSSSDFARSAPGALGQHASSFDSPRLGIGNVAYLFTGTHQPGLLAGALGGTCS